ncbi:hypothetical protein F5Y00DRAFT_270234 [Daldinia vernicosa]|uniref:uncharacterized protein n=1 Tax=Daldinia vernicosa TaxID=114800 RepID=UPI002007659C|nr:uncharacterized protein F5Y00DRAFT_270234 [Daldinia vernicosa]KAI0848527.1 hypothetical protein F5Y00DRAFT_270234 [Daldinia vernicosa]
MRTAARIPSRDITWSLDNLFVGRGATKYLSAAAAVTPDLQRQNDGFRLDPPIYYPPTSPQKGGSREGVSPSYPFYTSPLISKIATPSHPSTKEDLYYAKASAAVAAQVEAETETESKSNSLRQVPAIKLSNKIHVVGFDTHARFVAHALAADPKLPPVQMLTHSPISMKAWGQEGRAVSIHDSKGHPISSREILCPDYVSRRYNSPVYQPILDNIILSTAARAAFPTLHALRERIDRRTTVCLLEPGLGLMEMLNEEVFNVPALRPNYVICHSSHKLARHSYHKYSLRHIPGNLYLHAVPRDDEDEDIDRVTSQLLGNQHTRHMIDILSAAGDLNAVDVSWKQLLLHKLPDMIFQSLADTLSAILDCSFNLIRSNRSAMRLWENMLAETIHIISSIPDFQGRRKLRFLHERQFATKLRVRLERQGTEYSHWIREVRMGKEPPAQFLNGYFVRRAQEVGVDHRYNSLAISMLKARVESRRKMHEIPFNIIPEYDDY